MMKTLLITGASSGIGFSTAKDFVQKGHRVYAGYRNPQDAEKLKEIGAIPLLLDVTDPTQREKAFELLEKLDVLINNAGYALAGPVEYISQQDLEKQFQVNLFGVFALIQLALPLLRQSSDARIINVSSISGRVAAPFLSPYSSSKFALEALTDSLRREVTHQGIQVISINPGPIRTPIWQKGLNIGQEVLEKMPQEGRDIYGQPLQKFEKIIEEVARTAAPVEEVVNCMRMAVQARSPKTRYFPGKGIYWQALLARFAPDRIIDRLTRSRYG